MISALCLKGQVVCVFCFLLFILQSSSRGGGGGLGEKSSIKVPNKGLFFPCGHPYSDALLGLARQSTGFSSLVKLRESRITRIPVG